jgi:hypothetical protein
MLSSSIAGINSSHPDDAFEIYRVRLPIYYSLQKLEFYANSNMKFCNKTHNLKIGARASGLWRRGRGIFILSLGVFDAIAERWCSVAIAQLVRWRSLSAGALLRSLP